MLACTIYERSRDLIAAVRLFNTVYQRKKKQVKCPLAALLDRLSAVCGHRKRRVAENTASLQRV